MPEGSRIVGEAWTTISATGSYFSDQANPQVAVRVGEKGCMGVVEITDILFSTVGPGQWLILHRVITMTEVRTYISSRCDPGRVECCRP